MPFHGTATESKEIGGGGVSFGRACGRIVIFGGIEDSSDTGEARE